MYTAQYHNPQANRPQRPALVVPPQDHSHLEANPTIAILTNTQQLIDNPNFLYYSQFNQLLLEADNDHWRAVDFLRQSQSPLVPAFCASIRYVPPPDMFRLLALIRRDEAWNTMRHEVLRLVSAARRRSASSFPGSAGSGLTPQRGTHLTPVTASVHSTSPRGSQFQLPCGVQLGRAGSGRQPSSHGPGSSYGAGSPTPSQGNAGRTAPENHLFYCPSKNCNRSYPRKGFTRQGHYENHMDKNHAEWPSHDALTSLKERPPHEHQSAAISYEPGGASRGTDNARLTVLQPASTTPASYTPFPRVAQSEIRSQPAPPPGDIDLDLDQFGAATDIHSATQESLDVVFSPHIYQNGSGGVVPQVSYEFPDGQEQFLQALGQTNSNSNQSFYTNDIYMDEQ